MTTINRLGSTHRGPSQRRPWRTIVAWWIGLVVWLGASAAWAQFLPRDPTQVVINAAGGQTSADGLRIHLGNRGGIQVVSAGSGQYYGDVPTGPNGVNNGYFMAVGPAGSATVYGPQLDIQWTATAWTPVSQTAVTGQGTAADPYQVITIVSAGGFRLAQTVRYVVPNVYFEVQLTLVPPAGNTQNVRVYHWLDTYLAGGDYGAAFWQPNSNPTVVGVEKNGQYELLIQGSRAWNAYFSGAYYRPGQLMELGGALDNTLDIDPNTDNGIAVQWDIAAPSSPVTWTYRLATGQNAASTFGDGLITGYETCDDGNTNDHDGCSSISQVEAGYTCIGSPSICTMAAPPAITSADATTFTVGTAGTFTVTTSGSPTPAIGTASPLPSGITLVDNGNGTATLSGTAAYGQGGVYTLAITAANGASQTFTLTVASVTSFSGPTATGTGIATAAITGGGVACTFLGDAAFINASSVGTPVPLQFPHGLFSFTLRGCTGSVTLTVTYPSALPPGSAYWKYGPQYNGAPSTWYQFVAAPTSASAVYSLTLANNALGDDDWDATTDIVDQGGPGAGASPVAIPTVGAIGLTLLACLLAVAGLLMLRTDGKWPGTPS